MPLGDIVAACGLQLVLELLIYGVGYWSGFVVLKLITFGSIRIAPFSTIEQKNRGKRWDWSLFLILDGKRHLKGEVVALIGIIALTGFGILLYKSKQKETEPNNAMEPTPVAVTNRAFPRLARARFAPSTSAAHLWR